MINPKEYFGIGASSGIGMAPVLTLKPLNLNIEKRKINNPENEILRLKKGQEKVRIQIESIRDDAKNQHEAWTLKIFDSHLLLIDDPELENATLKLIRESKVSAEFALLTERNNFVSLLNNSSNTIIKERIADLLDVTNRIIAFLTNQEQQNLSELQEDSIIVASDLSPLETSRLNSRKVKGIITEEGGYTGHTAIMARSLGIPAVTGLKGAVESLKSGEIVFINGGNDLNKKGYVLLSPSPSKQKEIQNKIFLQEKERKRLQQFINKKSLSKDGVELNISAHVGTADDLKSAIKQGADGIGLFRTEFLFMEESDFPDEEKQYLVYKKVLESMRPKPVIIRTIDIGGDKKIPYINFPIEENPFLGVRGIRYCLKNQEVFRTQIRALLRASSHGNLKIMFPMIATKEEFIQAKGILNEEAIFLEKQKNLTIKPYKIGIMIEIPSAALIAEELAPLVDFFSIGSNDLIQYTMAADRMNQEVSYLYQPLHPAILKLIKLVVDAAQKSNIEVGICGEMGGDLSVIPTLLKMGVTELSMASGKIPAARELISQLNLKADRL